MEAGLGDFDGDFLSADSLDRLFSLADMEDMVFTRPDSDLEMLTAFADAIASSHVTGGDVLAYSPAVSAARTPQTGHVNTHERSPVLETATSAHSRNTFEPSDAPQHNALQQPPTMPQAAHDGLAAGLDSLALVQPNCPVPYTAPEHHARADIVPPHSSGVPPAASSVTPSVSVVPLPLSFPPAGAGPPPRRPVVSPFDHNVPSTIHAATAPAPALQPMLQPHLAPILHHIGLTSSHLQPAVHSGDGGTVPPQARTRPAFAPPELSVPPTSNPFVPPALAAVGGGTGQHRGPFSIAVSSFGGATENVLSSSPETQTATSDAHLSSAFPPPPLAPFATAAIHAPPQLADVGAAGWHDGGARPPPECLWQAAPTTTAAAAAAAAAVAGGYGSGGPPGSHPPLRAPDDSPEHLEGHRRPKGRPRKNVTVDADGHIKRTRGEREKEHQSALQQVAHDKACEVSALLNENRAMQGHERMLTELVEVREMQIEFLRRRLIPPEELARLPPLTDSYPWLNNGRKVDPADVVRMRDPNYRPIPGSMAPMEAFKTLDSQQLMPQYQRVVHFVQGLLSRIDALAGSEHSPTEYAAAVDQLDDFMIAFQFTLGIVIFCNNKAFEMRGMVADPLAPILPPEGHWQYVISVMQLDDDQRRRIVEVYAFCRYRLMKLQRERAGLAGELNALVTASTSLNALSVCEQAELADKLFRNVHNERSIILIIGGFIRARVLTPTQRARCMCASYPYMPDMLTISAVLYDQTAKTAGRG